MPDAGPLLKYLHILAAMVYVTGYLAGGMLQAGAGRANDWPMRRELMRWANVFTTKMLIPAFITAGVLGVITALVMGYPLDRGWVLYALIVYAILFVVGIAYWSPLERKQLRAIEAQDEAAFRALGAQASVRFVTIADGALLLLLIYLMVVKPA